MRPDGVRSAPDGKVDKAALGRALVVALLAVAGVRRLEPSLRTTLQRPSLPGVVTALPVRLRRRVGGDQVADLSIDIATDRSAPAVQIADAVQQRAREVLTEHDVAPGVVEVSVLAVEV